MKLSKTTIVIIALAIFIFGIALFRMNLHHSQSVNDQDEEIITQEQTVPQNNGMSVSDERADSKNKKKTPPTTSENNEKLQKLQSLLDDDSANEQTIAYAKELFQNGNAKERLASLDAFLWLGGRTSVECAINGLKDVEAVSRRSSEVLSHLIQTDLIDDENLMTTELWLTLINSFPNAAQAEPFIITLSAFPTEQAAPALIELMKSSDQGIADCAREYLSQHASGKELKNYEDAKAWFESAYPAVKTTEQP